MGGNEQRQQGNSVQGYVPTPVSPTQNYPFRTDYEFVHGLYPHETQGEDQAIPQGMVNFPNLKFNPQTTYQTHIIEADKKFYIVPSFREGQDPEKLFRKHGLHLGAFNTEDDALQYEKDYLTPSEDDLLNRLNIK